jgi:hypothetical protein
MSKPRETFIDPLTGEEVESTPLARWGALQVRVLLGVLVGVLVLVPAVFVMLAMALLGFVPFFEWLSDWDFWGTFEWVDSVSVRVHNWIARQQYWCRQRLRRRERWQAERLLQQRLLEAEWAGVPDGAISRARPPDEPEPTDTSLSRAAGPEADPPPHSGLQPTRRQRILHRLQSLAQAQPPSESEPAAGFLTPAGTPEKAAPRLPASADAVTGGEELLTEGEVAR